MLRRMITGVVGRSFKRPPSLTKPMMHKGPPEGLLHLYNICAKQTLSARMRGGCRIKCQVRGSHV